MTTANHFLALCHKYQFEFFTGTPCSYLKPFINSVIDDPASHFVVAVNEGEAVGLAAGAWLGGKKSVVMFQNSGLGNAVNPITSLSKAFEIPFLGIVTLRGEPGGPKDEPQHTLMGSITTAMLDLMQVPWAYFPQSDEEVEATLKAADQVMNEQRTPYFLVMKKDSVSESKLKTKKSLTKKTAKSLTSFDNTKAPELIRTEALTCLTESLGADTAYIATTGKTGRELFEVGDRENNFYMVGSMGLAPSIALGLKIARPQQKVCVIDGDGALLMRMGGLATIGALAPNGYYHVLLNNHVHDSTGGQSSDSDHVDFALIAHSCGIEHTLTTTSGEELQNFLATPEMSGPRFAHFRIRAGSPESLGRPTVGPVEVARRFKNFILSQN